ncbi:MAG: sigma-70 family RNA polymerase sigma factor [Eubacteriales bacterium]|nr:sigma-70 family RNA polymerase sigma factor [Eubacteriales bacterium]
MDDHQIIDMYWNRKEQAILETERKYTKFCFGIAWNILFNKEDSEECLNDTWLAAWNSIPPRKPNILSAFLGRITRNLAIDCFRKKGAGKRMDTHIADICQEVEGLGNIISYTLDDYIRKKEIIQILNDFLAMLSARDRDIFIRRYWYMDNIRDIAKRHECSESKIKSILFRSRKKLFSLLDE